MREVAAAREERAARAITAEVAQRREQLAGMKAPLWELPAVTEWATTFLSVHPRCKFLILHADSRAGEASFAEGLLQNPFVVTVDDNPSLGLKGFSRADRQTLGPSDKNSDRATRGDNTGH